MTQERSNQSRGTRGMHKAMDVSYNEQAGGLKVVGPVVGKLKRLFAGSSDLLEPYKPGGVVAFYNPTGATAWLTIGEAGAAPAAPGAAQADSIALKPNDYTILAMPKDASAVNCDVNTVVAYLVEDDSVIA